MSDIFSLQDPRLVEAAQKLARAVSALPSDPDTKPRALLVGGFVRDVLLGVRSHDVDMEVYGVDPERLASLLEETFDGRANAVGEAFGILKVPLGDGMDLDVSIPRRESKQGKGHAGFLIESDPSMTIEDAARRRDFTVNAMLIDPLTEELVDPFDGKKDLAQKLLRVVDRERFQDDPLRVYRAVQFAARFNFTFEAQTFALMREMVERGDLKELSKERVTDEIKKLMLKSPRPSIGFERMRELGIIERDYPELHAMTVTPQEPEWHPEGDVWVHTMMVIDHAARIVNRTSFSEEERLQVILGALCHDLGKPLTTAMGEKHGIPRIRSLGHEEAGAEPTKVLFARWSFSQDVEDAAVAIAMQHLKPWMLAQQKEKGELTEESYANAVRKLIKKIHPVSWRVLLAAAEADFRGRTIPGVDEAPYTTGQTFAATVEKLHLDQEPTKPLVQGRDLQERGLKPGPQFGKIIEKIEEARDRGEVKTREEALELLEKLLSS